MSDVGAVTGACLITRREVYEQAGGLDEGLSVAFGNDVDFCIRVRAAGRYVVYLPHVAAVHAESKSRGRDDTPEKVARFAAEIAGMRAPPSGRDRARRPVLQRPPGAGPLRLQAARRGLSAR